jgi:hypothetical protein
MKLKDSELKAILAEVQADLDKSLDLEVKKLSKAAGEDEMPAEEPEMSAAPAEETPGEDHAPAEETPGEEHSAPADEAPMGDEPPADEASAPADPAAEDPAAADGAEGAMSPEELEAEYSKLDPETLKMHYLAAKAALFAAMGGGAGGAPEASAPAAPPAAPPAAGPGMEASAPAPAMKSEKNDASLSKAEKAELETLREQVKLQEKLFDLLNAPARKAVTAVDFVAKSEEKADKRVLSKSEVASKLKTVTADAKLSKSDRELVNGYVLGTVSIDKIEHLLK